VLIIAITFHRIEVGNLGSWPNNKKNMVKNMKKKLAN
jgi:hypothetical protein